MKRQITRQLLCVSLGILGSVCAALAQASGSLSIPEYDNKYYEVSSDNKLVSLESVQPKSENKGHNVVYKVTSSTVLVVPGTASAVRVPPTAHFVVKGDTGGRDPNDIIKLAKLTIGKNDRELPQSKATGSIMGAHSSSVDITYIPITVKKYADRSYEVIPSSPIPPGEYALYPEGLAAAHMDCFGVDGQ